MRYTFEIQRRYDKFFLEHDDDDTATAVLFCAEVARFSKTVPNQYLSPFCAPFSVQSALSLDKFINYECCFEDLKKGVTCSWLFNL